MTNADRIRAMSDEELARHLDSAFVGCDFCSRIETEEPCNDTMCIPSILEWLRQPVEVKNDE